MAQVGRISGPLLYANLERNGIDLAFRNDLNTNQLLYLDVNNGRIGVDTSTPANELENSQTTRTVNLIGDFANLAGYTVNNSTLSTIGDLYINAGEAVVITTLDNGTIRINDNTIRTTASNADIDITPNGTGSVRIGNGFLNDDSTADTKADLNIFGNLHTPGNITFEGTITLGDQNTDDVTFNSDINSDIIPDVTDTYNLGSQLKEWSHLYTNLLNGQLVGTQQYFLNGVDLSLRHGGIIYVAQEGDDSHKGDHVLDPLATISAALAKADASGDQPFTIIVSPGEYQEALPLVVPNNVSVIGADIRNVIITPDTSSQSEDVFHLNDKTLVANLTIRNHYYDSVNNTGYAFRFAPNAVMSERSPYIQNVTVLTQETSNGAGDSGRGAWIDGDELNAATINKTMLFHSCTFISPGADVINMTNDVRVEWLNSFTYYANRGLYAFAGANGGAELRSIGSANVYGTYGAVADGADTLMYLIQHNFAYIGAGNDNTNNLDLVVQANEVVELNSGQIHYVSTDQLGNFRVGDNFFVDLESGNTSINIDTATIDALSGLNITTPGGTTVLDASFISTGNIRIFGNDIETVVGDLNLKGATGTINMNDNTSVSGNLDIVNNFSFGGTLNIAGDQPGRDTAADRLVFNVQFEQDFNPHQHLTHSLGEVQRPWLNSWLSRLEVNDITFDGNVITTDISNANLELRASGTSEILIPTNNTRITNNLTTGGLTDLQDTIITNTVTHIGNYNQTGDYNIAGTFATDDIQFAGNVITTDISNANLELRASGTGEILIPTNNVQINNNLTVNGDTTLKGTTIVGDITHTGNTTQTGDFNLTGNLDVTGEVTISASVIQFEEIQLTGNTLTTTESNADLELRAAGTGKILIPNNNVEISNNLSVNDIFNTSNVNINLATVFNYASLSNIDITQNYITATNLNEDLILRAAGTGIVNIASSGYVENNLTVNTKTFLQDGNTTYEYGPELIINGTFDTNTNGWTQTGGGSGTAVNGNLRIDATGAARNVSQEIIVEVGKTYDFEAQFKSVSNGNPFYLRIFESGVGTLFEWNETSGLTNNQLLTFSIIPQTTAIDIIFRAVDTVVEWDNVSMFEDIGFVTAFTPIDVDLTNITQTGNTVQTGNVLQTGDTVISGGFTSVSDFIGPVVTIDNNVIKNTAEGLRMSTVSSDPSSIPEIVKAIVNGATAVDYPAQQDKNLVNFLINNNYVDVNLSGTLTTSDYVAWLQYIVNGSTPTPEYNDFLKPIIDEILVLEKATPGYFNPVIFFGDYKNPNLELRANTTGNILIPNNTLDVENDVFAASIIANDITVDRDLLLNEIVITDSIIEIDDNFISTTTSNANLELRAMPNKLIVTSEDVTIENNLTVNGTSNLKNTSIVGNITHAGNRNQLGNLNVIGNVTVSSTNIESEIQFDNILFNDNYIETTESNSDLELRANGTGIISVNDNLEITNNLSITGLNSNNINVVSNLVTKDIKLSSNIEIFDNVIRTTESNSNLELRTADNSSIHLQNLIFNGNVLSTASDNIELTSENVIINSTSDLLLPTGNISERTSTPNSIRFNSEDGLFEGYNQSNILFGGVYSDNKRTSLTAHPTNNTIIARTNNVQRVVVNSDSIDLHGLTVDDISIKTNVVRADVSNAHLDLQANGTGKLVLDDISITGSTIQNNSLAALVVSNRGYGKSKFGGTKAVKIPSGTTAEQPGFTPEVGMMRWNTELSVLEAWDGSTFISAAGESASISQEEMDDLILEYTLIFG